MTNRSGRRPSTVRDNDETPVMRQRIMPITTRTLIASSTLAATITLPASAQADDSVINDLRFQSPSGDIVCVMQRNHDTNDPADYGKGEGTCHVQNPTYAAPPPQYVGPDGRPGTCYSPGWGSQFSLHEGRPPHLDCVGHLFTDPPLPTTLEYGESMSLGAITCASEPSGITCTDTSSGRFFRASRDSYQLG